MSTQTKAEAGHDPRHQVGGQEPAGVVGEASAPLKDIIRRFPRFEPVQEYDDEATFRARLAAILRSYGFEVYAHDPGIGCPQFSVRGARGYVDLYCITPADYDWQRQLPVIAIETKLSKNLKWLRQAADQVKRYIDQVLSARYWVDGEEVQSPSVFLVCTQDSWNSGHIYEWRRPDIDSRSQDFREGYLQAVTDMYDRLLLWPKAAILRGGPGGARFYLPQRRYDLAW